MDLNIVPLVLYIKMKCLSVNICRINIVIDQIILRDKYKIVLSTTGYF
jgi:hypothetical protein